MRHVREAVRFDDGVQALRAAGVTRFVEVGPGTALTSMVAEASEAASAVRDAAQGPPGAGERGVGAGPAARRRCAGRLGSVLRPGRRPACRAADLRLRTSAVLADAARRDVQADTVDDEFWDLVERGDLEGLGRWRSLPRGDGRRTVDPRRGLAQRPLCRGPR